MPELPEVETVKETLKKRYEGKEFSSVEVYYPNILANISAEEFKKVLVNQKIESFSRLGKFLIFNLSNGFLISHLRMEGKYKFSEALFDKHSHILFRFKDNDVLIYHDVRKFGRMYYFPININIYKAEPLANLGLEPFKADATYLKAKLKNKDKEIKLLLLDQSILAGIGNIYADEILFASKINPLRKGKDISLKECEAIINNACLILNAAIKDGGSTIKSFQSSHGVDGLFQVHLLAYGKEGMPCVNCKTLMKKIKLGGRGTCFCPNCQKG